MIECAQHFENKEEYDKAIQLYHKGGDIPHALELCFRIGEESNAANANGRPNKAISPHAAIAFDMLNSIAQDLGVDSSPQTLARCADFLVQHKQYDKAIELYVMAKRYHAAIEMIIQQRVNLTDEMVEKLTPPEQTPVASAATGSGTGAGANGPSDATSSNNNYTTAYGATTSNANMDLGRAYWLYNASSNGMGGDQMLDFLGVIGGLDANGVPTLFFKCMSPFWLGGTASGDVEINYSLDIINGGNMPTGSGAFIETFGMKNNWKFYY
jgi:hypothetical protein